MAEAEDSKIFPQKLMEILNDPNNEDSICWLPHGKAFRVLDRKRFAETVMPQWFSRKAKYSSFTRKLNRCGPEIGAYHHEFFRKDKPHLAATMFCKNARTMLAMTSANSGRADVTPSFETSSYAATNNITDTRVERSEDSLRERLLQQQAPMNSSSALLGGVGAHGLLGGLGTNGLHASANMQMLERQIMFLQQQEETNRLLLEHALMVQQQQQRSLLSADEEQRKLGTGEDPVLGLRLGLQSQSRLSTSKPSSNRASAA